MSRAQQAGLAVWPGCHPVTCAGGCHSPPEARVGGSCPRSVPGCLCLLGQSKAETLEKKLHVSGGVSGDVSGDVCGFLMAARAVAASWAHPSARSTTVTRTLPPAGPAPHGVPGGDSLAELRDEDFGGKFDNMVLALLFF